MLMNKRSTGTAPFPGACRACVGTVASSHCRHCRLCRLCRSVGTNVNSTILGHFHSLSARLDRPATAINGVEQKIKKWNWNAKRQNGFWVLGFRFELCALCSSCRAAPRRSVLWQTWRAFLRVFFILVFIFIEFLQLLFCSWFCVLLTYCEEINISVRRGIF